MRRSLRRYAGAAAVGLLALAVTACAGGASGGSSGETVAVDVGNGRTVDLPTGVLKIGIFMNAQSNQWQQNLATAAKAKAESFGWDATILDFNFDQARMTDALLQASTNKTYDAIAVMPIDGQQSCRMLTETLPANDILVTVGGTTACGKDLASGDEMWAPGTYSYNTVAPSYDYAKVFLERTAALFPGPQRAAIVVGPEQNGNTVTMHRLAEEFARTNPDFRIVDFINTDFTTPTTFTAVQAYLQAHRNTTVLMSVYSPDLSRGVVQALDSLDLVGKINVTDMGGSQYSADEIKAGAIQLTMPYYPKSIGENLIQSIRDAQEGRAPVRVVDEIPGGLAQTPVVTTENVGDFTPQF